MTTLPLDPSTFWFLVSLSGLAILAWLVFHLLPKTDSPRQPPLIALRERLGMTDLPEGLFFLAVVLWGLIFTTLFFGLYHLIWDILWYVVPDRANATAVWEWRFKLVQVTALTTVLGAVLVFPITLTRLRLQRQQTEHAAAVLFNEKFNTAASDLYSRMELTEGPFGARKQHPPYNKWVDDSVRRTAAVNRLFSLVEEKPSEAGRVADLLSVYVRELSRDFSPHERPSSDRYFTWAFEVEPYRTDVETAAQKLGKLKGVRGVDKSTVKIDLRRANLQGFDLSGSDFSGANFYEAHLDGAYVYKSNFCGANFNGARLTGVACHESSFSSCKMDKADLRGGMFDKSNFEINELKGYEGHAHHSSKFDASQMIRCTVLVRPKPRTRRATPIFFRCNFRQALFEGLDENSGCLFSKIDTNGLPIEHNIVRASFRNCYLDTQMLSRIDLKSCFADGSVRLQTSKRPTHWPNEVLSDKAFEEARNAFWRSIGMDPEAPE